MRTILIIFARRIEVYDKIISIQKIYRIEDVSKFIVKINNEFVKSWVELKEDKDSFDKQKKYISFLLRFEHI